MQPQRSVIEWYVETCRQWRFCTGFLLVTIAEAIIWWLDVDMSEGSEPADSLADVRHHYQTCLDLGRECP